MDYQFRLIESSRELQSMIFIWALDNCQRNLSAGHYEKHLHWIPFDSLWFRLFCFITNRRKETSEACESVRKWENTSMNESQTSTGKAQGITSIDADMKGVEGGRLTEEETIEVGSIPFSTYMFYVRCAGGILVALLVVVIFSINIASSASSSWWLAHWLNVGVAVSCHNSMIFPPPSSISVS